MTDILNQNVTVTVSVAGTPVESQEFGEVLYIAIPSTLGGGFTERVRRYTTPAEVATDLAAGDLSSEIATVLNSAFAQRKRTGTLAVGRIDDVTAQQGNVTFGGTNPTVGEIFTVIVDGISFSYTALGAGTIADVVAALEAGLTPLLPDHSVADASPLLTINNDVGTNPSQILAITDSATTTVAVNITTPATPPGDEVDAILAEDDAWYMIATEWNTRGFQLAVAAWAETNKKPYMIQTADPQALVGPDATNQPITEAIKILDYDYSSANYYSVDAERFAYLWAVRKLATSPDTISVDWAYADLIGLTAPLQSLSQRTILDTANAGYFGGFFGNNVAFRGETGSGLTLENRVTIDWLEARIAEDVSAALLNASANDRKLPYSDPGFNNVRGIVQARLETGLSTSHLLVELDPLSGERTSPTATVPRRSAVSAGDESAKNVPVTFNATTANSIQQVSVTGYLSLTV